MTVQPDKLVIVGRIGSAHGLRGWVKIQSFTEPRNNITEYQPWLVKLKQQWVSIEVKEFSKKSNQLLAHLPGVNDRNQACELTNADIAIYRRQLPNLENDEYYWDDLIGLTVNNIDGVILGVIDQIINCGANDILIVKTIADKNKSEHLIPFVTGRFVKKIDIENNSMIVDWDPDF